MKKRTMYYISTIVLLFLLDLALAHQPFFEDKEFDWDKPRHIKDPTVSTAIYATLETADDVDYYSFNGSSGQSILLCITIPQIIGQENFAPTMALMGKGLPLVDLPKKVKKPEDFGALILHPPTNATAFFEPFSRTSYWTRQEQYEKLPANGSYLVAVWDDKGQVGRYVFVIGDREIPGGDIAFPLKIRNYWAAVSQSTAKSSQESIGTNQTNDLQK
jgi:hypothetical protein